MLDDVVVVSTVLAGVTEPLWTTQYVQIVTTINRTMMSNDDVSLADEWRLRCNPLDTDFNLNCLNTG